MPFPSPALASSRQEVMRVRALDQQSAASRKKKEEGATAGGEEDTGRLWSQYEPIMYHNI